MTRLPTDIDASYGDNPQDPSVALHQQYHDALHLLYNALAETASTPAEVALLAAVRVNLGTGTGTGGTTDAGALTGTLSPARIADASLMAAKLSTAVQTQLSKADAALPSVSRGVAGGVASLDGTGTVPDAQIPLGVTRDSELAAALAALVNAAPGTLDTLGELAAALAADEGVAAALANTVAGKAAKNANLSDLTDKAAAFTNLGLQGAAKSPTGAFDPAGAAATVGSTAVRVLKWDGTGSPPALPAPGSYGLLIFKFPSSQDPSVVYPGQTSTDMEWELN